MRSLHNLSHNKVLHERVIFITLHNREIPWVPFSERIKVTDLKNNCYQIDVYYGFKMNRTFQTPLELCRPFGLEFEPLETSVFHFTSNHYFQSRKWHGAVARRLVRDYVSKCA